MRIGTTCGHCRISLTSRGSLLSIQQPSNQLIQPDFREAGLMRGSTPPSTRCQRKHDSISVSLRMTVQIVFVVLPTVARHIIPCRRRNRFPDSPKSLHRFPILKIKRLRRLQNPVSIRRFNRPNHRHQTLYDAPIKQPPPKTLPVNPRQSPAPTPLRSPPPSTTTAPTRPKAPKPPTSNPHTPYQDPPPCLLPHTDQDY